jgi:hypothetical protein
MAEIQDQHLHDLLIRADLEDMTLLHGEVSAYLEFWRIAEESVAAAERRQCRRVTRPR